MTGQEEQPPIPYRDCPEGWWTALGGHIDPASNVVRLPPHTLYRCGFPECPRCHEK